MISSGSSTIELCLIYWLWSRFGIYLIHWDITRGGIFQWSSLNLMKIVVTIPVEYSHTDRRRNVSSLMWHNSGSVGSTVISDDFIIFHSLFALSGHNRQQGSDHMSKSVHHSRSLRCSRGMCLGKSVIRKYRIYMYRNVCKNDDIVNNRNCFDVMLPS